MNALNISYNYNNDSTHVDIEPEMSTKNNESAQTEKKSCVYANITSTNKFSTDSVKIKRK